MGQFSKTDQGNPDTVTMRKMGYTAPERSSVLMSCSLDCIKLLSPEGNITYMSHNGMCAMEIEDLEVVVGKPWWTFWPEPQQDTIQTAVTAAGKARTVNFVADFPTARGTAARWDVTVQGVLAEDDTLREIIAVSRRTTEPLRDISTF